MKAIIAGVVLLATAAATGARAETTECTVITSVPTLITAQGVYCLKSNLATGETRGTVIGILTNNVTIDMNGFKLGGLGAGPATQAIGIGADDQRNIVIRNGTIRGFNIGVSIAGSDATSSGIVIEDLILDGNTRIGIHANGSGISIVDNQVVNTDSTGQTKGISLVGSNSKVGGNLVARTISSDRYATGIDVTGSSNVDVFDNRVFETSGALEARAVFVASSSNVTVQRNTLLDTTSGTATAYGIEGGAGVTGLYCFDNSIAAAGTAQTDDDCDSEVGTLPAAP